MASPQEESDEKGRTKLHVACEQVLHWGTARCMIRSLESAIDLGSMPLA